MAEKTKVPPRPIYHIEDIMGTLRIKDEDLDSVPVLYEVASRQYSLDQLWRIKELPKERYRVLYTLSTGDVMDLSIRFHHMATTHKIGSSIFEFKELMALYKIDDKVDTYKTFQEKVKPFVIVERLDTASEERLIYKLPYESFRQHFFTIGNANPVIRLGATLPPVRTK